MEFVPEQKDKSIFKTYLIYFICMAVFVLVRIMSAIGVFSNLTDNAIDIIYTLIIEVGCLFVLPLILYCVFLKVKPRKVFRTCNFNRVNFKTIIISVVLGFVIYFLTVMLSTFFNGIITMFGYSSSSSGAGEITLTTYIIQIFTTAILPAFCEEFMHRGLVLQGTKHIGFHRAIMISSVLFGLIHLNITQVFYATILGMVMGYAAVVSKNIWPAIIVHFMNNFMSITNSFLLSASDAYATFVNGIYGWLQNINFIILVLISTIILMVLMIVIYVLINRLYYNGMVKRVEQAIGSVYARNGSATSNEPITFSEQDVKYLVESTTTLNLDFNSVKNPIDIMMPKQTKIYKSNYRDNIFLKSSLILGSIITVFTFIWGLM